MGGTVVWLRQDLRLRDNEALHQAVARGGPVVPLFIWSPEEEGAWPPGAASRAWLHRSLTALDAALRDTGSRLVVRRGPAEAVLSDVARETGADAVVWTRRYEPVPAMRDAHLQATLASRGVRAIVAGGACLVESEALRNAAGRPYQVFTAFARGAQAHLPPARPRAAPAHLPPPETWPESVALEALGLWPEKDWAAGMLEGHVPGEAGAAAALRRFVRTGAGGYEAGRDQLGVAGTSRLSAHLHWGEISPRGVWHAVADADATAAFRRQLLWREFAIHLLHHFPQTEHKPLRPDFERFPWRHDDAALAAWTRGRTGYPIVDAGLRELWATGLMHNRVRMIAGSFLVKHLLLPWQDGARWFWDTLVDADLANNTLGWQWVAGCGADAAPYFRIFNPERQGVRFDPDGAYVRRWVPELAKASVREIHTAWSTPRGSYPAAIVPHASARARALAAFAGRQSSEVS